MAHITLRNISKRYRKNMRSFGALFGYMFSIPHPDDFWALDDISLDLKDGDILGIIGHNGAGKSTLLKIISGITTPTKGTRSISGRIAPLIEVGAGFQPELTGYENIFFYGTVLGMSRKEIKEKLEDIIEFSGVEDMIHTPVKFYSSGMFARLGFAITVHADPEILIIDEALAVGDPGFQEKCFKKVAELQKSGCITILVSHDLNMIQNHTNTCIWLNKGKIREYDETRKVLEKYKIKKEVTDFCKIPFKNSFVDTTLSIEYPKINKTDITEKTTISIEFLTIHILPKLCASVSIFTEDNMLLYTDRYIPLPEKERYALSVDFPSDIFNTNTKYYISFGFFTNEPWVHIGDSDRVELFFPKEGLSLPGYLKLQTRWKIEETTS